MILYWLTFRNNSFWEWFHVLKSCVYHPFLYWLFLSWVSDILYKFIVSHLTGWFLPFILDILRVWFLPFILAIWRITTLNRRFIWFHFILNINKNCFISHLFSITKKVFIYKKKYYITKCILKLAPTTSNKLS